MSPRTSPARPALRRALALQLKQRQGTLAAATGRQVRMLWQARFDPARANASFGAMRPDLAAVLRARHGNATALGRQYYQMMGAAAGAPAFTGLAAAGPGLTDEHIAKVTGGTGPGAFLALIAAGWEPDAAAGSAGTSLGSACENLVLSGCRDTITAASAADAGAEGWERIADDGACEFCAGLAGQLYRDDAGFEAHNNCGCTAAPVFTGGGS